MSYNFSNLASTTLNGAITAAQTSITVTNGNTFPAAPFMAAFTDANNNIIEFIYVTAMSGVNNVNWTVTRQSESSSAYPAGAWASATNIVHVTTAATLTNFVQADTTQTISGAKTFTSLPSAQFTNPGWLVADGTNHGRLALASNNGAYHSAALTGDVIVVGDNASNTQAVLLAAGPTSTGYLRIGSTGSTLGGSLTSGSITTSAVTTVSGSNGSIVLQPGGGAQTGYVEFRTPSTSVRQGYIGFSTTTASADTGTIPYVAGTHAFTGAVTTTGNLSENGNRVYSAGNAPPYPVTSVAGRTGAVVVGPADIASGTFPGNYTIPNISLTGSMSGAAGATISTAGSITSGAQTGNGFYFAARDSSRTWAWYSQTGTASLYNGTSDVLTVSPAGAIGAAAINLTGTDSTIMGSSGTVARMRITDDGTYSYIQTDRTLRFAPYGSSTRRADIDTSGNLTTAGSIVGSMSSATNVHQMRMYVNAGSAYSNTMQIFLDGSADTTYSPRLAFHLGNVVASQIGMDRSGNIRTYDNPGTGYAAFLAGAIYDNGNRVYSASNTPPYPNQVQYANQTWNDNAWQSFHWSGQSGQPTWLWGSNDGANNYVWNPSNFSVNYANSAGSANSVAWGNVGSKPFTWMTFAQTFGTPSSGGLMGITHNLGTTPTAVVVTHYVGGGSGTGTVGGAIFCTVTYRDGSVFWIHAWINGSTNYASASNYYWFAAY